MKVDILGYWGGYPCNGGATAGILVTTVEGRVLLDCGSGIMSKLSLHTKVENLSGVVLSHLHHDHTADVGILQYAAFGALRTGRMNKKLPLYAPNEPQKMWNQIQSNDVEISSIDASSKVKIANFDIAFHEVNHTIPCFAVKMTYKGKVFVYSADTSYIETLAEFAKDADLFICEATICEGSVHTVGKGHMNANQAGQIARKANVKELVLTHLPSDGNFPLMKQQAIEAFGQKAYLANEKDSHVI